MKSLILVALSATVLLASCGKSRTPNDTIKAVDTELTGFAPNPMGVQYKPVEVHDTLYTLSPSWPQANQFAAGRGDHPVWVVIGIVLLALLVVLVYGSATDASWIPNMGGHVRGALMAALLAGSLVSFKWQALAIKGNNDIRVSKQSYDKAMRTAGSTRPIWDSLENGCHLNWGPYDCYK